MDNTNALLMQPAFANAVQFIWREAEILDRKDYRAWLDLWSPDGFYVVPIDPLATDFAATLNYAYDDDTMRALRVQRLSSGYSPSVTDAARTVRTVSRFTMSSDSPDTVDVRSAQVVVAYKRGVSALFAADVEHRIDLSGDEPRIVQKVVRLIDSTDALNAIGFLL
ncbi:Ring hydroxylating beta subunit (plasmid) [Caballeronia sp. SBC1]|uniref:aromatic-ring-hydroxylating dioxygenase subunit beta n=1 Tax=unclassified Caballeronia TaxID=2646786 RepID=UPI0013E0F6D3|nr:MULTISPECIES: aromatic-ring-hydroxylating dioxygenase subunit beta [unclassified Caballeronia]QIE30102.1 Ring hydroxylating beta subunit [Caballeronia sp. SBC2]QIN67458.1 Ring hydroxylating beta subunit [Caballeronia sp. SBC1]